MKSVIEKFIFGQCIVAIATSNLELLAELNMLLKPWQGKVDPSEQVNENWIALAIDVDQLIASGMLTGDNNLSQLTTETILTVLTQVMSKHSSYLWLDAASMLTSDNQLILLSGASMAGKTTLSLSMYLAYGWLALSEDVTLINPSTLQITPVARPSSLRVGCAQLIEQASGLRPEPLHANQWFFEKDMYVDKCLDAKVSIAIILESLDECLHQDTAKLQDKDKFCGAEQPLQLERISSEQYVRHLLPLSNALRLPGAIETLAQVLSGANCFSLKNGSVKERMETLLNISKTRSNP